MTTLHHTLTLPTLAVDLTWEDVASHLRRIPGGERLFALAEEVFAASGRISAPAALLTTLTPLSREDGQVAVRRSDTGQEATLALGWSATFLAEAEVVVAGAYTIGPELQQQATEVAKVGDYLHAYLLEQLGLALLGRTAAAVNAIIEEHALARGWGLGPLLSPGSVHGWELPDQAALCRLLPLAEIAMACSEAGVLSPFNSLTFIVGLGPGYSATRIGSPCEVCNNRDSCQLRRQNP
jgi:hypothetical protein